VKKVKQPHGGEISLAEKGDVLNPKGRPKKGVSAFVQEMKAAGFEPATPTDIVEAFQFLVSLPADKVMEIAGNPVQEYALGNAANKYPIIVRLVAGQMLSKRGQEMLKQILDRTMGQAAQKAEVEHTFTNTAKYTLPDGTVIEI